MSETAFLTVTFTAPPRATRSFEDLAAFSAWFKQEFQLWEPLLTTLSNSALQLAAHIPGRLSIIKSSLEQIEVDQNTENNLVQLRGRLNDFPVSLQSAPGNLVLQLNDPSITPWAQVILVGLLLGESNREHYSRYPIPWAAASFVFFSYKYEMGNFANKSAHQSLSALIAELTVEADKARAANKLLLEENEALKEANQKFLKDASEQFASLQLDQNTRNDAALSYSGQKHREFMEHAEAEKRRLENLYMNDLKLKAPVQYWKDRGKSHGRWALGFGMTFPICAAALGWVIYAVGQALFEHIDKLAGKADPAASAQSLLLNAEVISRIGIIILLVTLGTWVLRILARIFLGNLHLWTECGERATMVNTYLALLNEGKVSDQERGMALATVFRPSTTGMIKDDAAPPAMFDSLIKKHTDGD